MIELEEVLPDDNHKEAMPKGYESFTAERYPSTIRSGKLSFAQLRAVWEESSTVRSCVDSIVQEITTLPYRVRPLPGGSMKHAMEVESFLEDPNSNAETFPQLLSKVLRDLLVIGCGVVEKVKALDGSLLELYARDGATFTVEVDEHGVLQGYKQSFLGRTVEFAKDEIIYMVFCPTSYSRYGKPIIDSIIDEVATLLFTNAYIAKTFTEDEIPPGILNLGMIGKEAYERAKEEFQSKRGMKKNLTLRVIYGTKDVDWIQFKMPNREMQLNELRRSIELIIYRNFGILPLEAGESATVNRSTAYTQMQLAQQRRVIPITNMISAFINKEIIQQEFHYNDVRFSFDVHEIFDPEAVARSYERYVRNGIMSRNEVRKALKLESIPGGDEYFLVAGSEVRTLDNVPEEDLPEAIKISQAKVIKTKSERN